ncbi:MAG: hypothetical protein ACKVOP_02630 [Sphingomonadaceae bacterium]
MTRAELAAVAFVGLCLIVVLANWGGMVELALTHQKTIVERVLVHFVAAPLVAGMLALIAFRARANRNG